jgi:hypothetical protein
MTSSSSASSSRWAPWWAYVIPVLAVNYLRQLALPPAEVGDIVSVALFAAITVLVVVAVTTAYRRSR